MGLKRLSDVKVGEIIHVGGVNYKVVLHQDLGRQILVHKEVAPGIYDTQNIGIGVIIQGYEGASWHMVTVVEQKKTNLTEQLRAQVKSKSLTDSFLHQLEQQEDDDEDWDDEEDEEEEDDDSLDWAHDGFSPFTQAHSDAYAVAGQPIQFGGVVPQIEEAKKTALTADLRSQQAKQTSNQARLDATLANQSVRKVSEDVRFVQTQVSGLGYDIGNVEDRISDVTYEVEKVADVAYDAQDAAYEAINRVAAIEQKQMQEEKKMNLQNELNAKLAAKKAQSDLQAQLNQKLNQKTTGGNGTMKNLLGNVFNFGKVEGKFAFPVTGGIALRKGLTNSFVAYNKDTKELTDVSGLTLKFDVPAFKLPVAANQVAVGDLIIHNGEFVYVVKKADGYLETLNPEKGVRGSVIPTKNALLNAAFYTVVKTLDAAGEGGFNPLLLMAMDKGSDKKDLLPLLLMSGGIGNGAAGSIDPTLLMLLGDDVEDLLPLVLMQQGGVTGEGFNPLFFLLSKKGKGGKDILPLLLATGGLQGGQAGAINPAMLMLMSDGDIDPMTLALMGGFGGQGTQAGAINPMMLLAMQDGGSDMKDLFLMQALTGQNIFGGAAPVQGHKEVKKDK